MVKLVQYSDGNDVSAETQEGVTSNHTSILISQLPTSPLVKNTCKKLTPYLTEEVLDHILCDAVDITTGKSDPVKDEHRSKATYPPAEMTASSFVILKQPSAETTGRTLKVKNSPESFLKIVSNAYSGTQRQEGIASKMLCNLISQQPDTEVMMVHAFEFDAEVEYWNFIGYVKRAVVDINNKTRSEHSDQSGCCRYLFNASSSPSGDTNNASLATAHGNNNNNSSGNGNSSGSASNNSSAAGTIYAGTGTSSAADSHKRAGAVPRKSGGSGAISTGGQSTANVPAANGFLGSLFAAAMRDSPKSHRWEIRDHSLVITEDYPMQFRGTIL
jgi:hypothetical protein